MTVSQIRSMILHVGLDYDEFSRWVRLQPLRPRYHARDYHGYAVEFIQRKQHA